MKIYAPGWVKNETIFGPGKCLLCDKAQRLTQKGNNYNCNSCFYYVWWREENLKFKTNLIDYLSSGLINLK
jgi:hypothetical protein